MDIKEILKELGANEKLKFVCTTNGKKLMYNGYFTRENKIIVEFAEMED